MITVVVVDDHPIVRAGLRTILAAAADIEVVAEGASGADALHLVAQHCPDVLVLDVNLPDLSGIEVTRRLAAQHLSTAILILTVHDDRATVFGLLDAGATGYVLKDDALETLAAAVRAAARGECWLSPAVAGQVVRRAVGGSPPQTAAGVPATPPSHKNWWSPNGRCRTTSATSTASWGSPLVRRLSCWLSVMDWARPLRKAAHETRHENPRA
ncbi:MAG: hypothetical protein CVU38_11360 [Chloroflexi bacterium HGW-Chloroflexi-1]|nr:MAG: hypothetical protein CVU38_11360 [Chloroflexi bacterium HGW-Chloroflexi-1]